MKTQIIIEDLETGHNDCVITAVNMADRGMGCRYFIREYAGEWMCSNDVCFPTQDDGMDFFTVGFYASLRNAQLAAIRDISKHALI